MIEVKNMSGQLKQIILTSSEWEELNESNEILKQKKEIYLEKIKNRRQFKKLQDGSTVGNLNI